MTVPDLLGPLAAGDGLEDGLAAALDRLLRATGAQAGALAFRPPREAPLVVEGGRRRLSPSLGPWLRAAVAVVPRRPRVARARPPGWPRGRGAALLTVPLGEGRGTLALLGAPRTIGRRTLGPGTARALGIALDRAHRLHRRARRLVVLGDTARRLAAGRTRDEVLRAFVDGVARLVPFDAVALLRLDADRGEVEAVDATARTVIAGRPGDCRLPLAGSLLAQVAASGTALRVDDARDGRVSAAGYRAALLVPLAAGGAVFGAIALAAARPAAFDDGDVEVVAELARPLAAALEQQRLLEESRRRADELATLYATSRLITGQTDLPPMLEAISRSIAGLIDGEGCGIGLLDEDGAHLRHVAAHGFRSDEWRRLAMPLGEGLIGRVARTGEPIRTDDIRGDPRSARRDVDEREGIRAMVSVPLTVADRVIGVVSVIARRVGAFTAHHQRVLEAFAEQVAIAIHHARLFEANAQRAREMRALSEAGRAVTASLDLQRTIHVILEEARAVLGADSCGLMTLDATAGELVSVASLDLPSEMVSQIRLRAGEGITGRAVAEGRPVQSRDLLADERVRFAHLSGGSGFRSMLAAPLRIGDRALGAITVLRRDVHEFSAAEEELLVALADQAAIALDHARLYAELEERVAERTRELETQKRFVEVVLEALPLGVFVLDRALRVVRANGEGARLFGQATAAGEPLAHLLPAEHAAPVEAFLRDVFALRRVAALEDELVVGGETRTFRLTAAPFDGAGAGVAHTVLLVEDVTRAKRLERQMLLTERLTTAGRLAAGVAHELNNPLATIAGCAESLQGRLREGDLAGRPEVADFVRYLSLIEEEAYRCKEITGSLLQFVREPGVRRSPTDVNGLVEKALELLRHQSRFAGARFATELDATLAPVTLNEGQIRQVVLGLASNGLEAMEGRGTLTVRTRRVRDEVEVEIEDEGPGIPDEHLARIFDPFFTTKPPGQGTGLGLAIAQGIVHDHGGRIEVTSRVGKGSLFRVALPIGGTA